MAIGRTQVEIFTTHVPYCHQGRSFITWPHHHESRVQVLRNDAKTTLNVAKPRSECKEVPPTLSLSMNKYT